MNFHTIQRLYTRDEIHDFIAGVWKTSLFRDIHAVGLESAKEYRDGGKHNFVSQIVDNFAKLPRFVFDMSHERLEWAHFSTWWGGIPNRKYDNPYIHDLYWIHEMAHAGSMVYVPDMTFENFVRKMTDNELYASVVSEVQAYFEIPELREVSFKHEIYADRFLSDKSFCSRYKNDPELTFEEMKVRRRDTMMDPNPTCPADFWIHRFYTQNAAWAACWAHSYNKIEATMAIVRDTANERLFGYDVGIYSRKRALDTFIDSFLKSECFYSSEYGQIPFFREAQAFSGVYWANRGHYDDAMTKITQKPCPINPD